MSRRSLKSSRHTWSHEITNLTCLTCIRQSLFTIFIASRPDCAWNLRHEVGSDCKWKCEKYNAGALVSDPAYLLSRTRLGIGYVWSVPIMTGELTLSEWKGTLAMRFLLYYKSKCTFERDNAHPFGNLCVQNLWWVLRWCSCSSSLQTSILSPWLQTFNRMCIRTCMHTSCTCQPCWVFRWCLCPHKVCIRQLMHVYTRTCPSKTVLLFNDNRGHDHLLCHAWYRLV